MCVVLLCVYWCEPLIVHVYAIFTVTHAFKPYGFMLINWTEPSISDCQKNCHKESFFWVLKKTVVKQFLVAAWRKIHRVFSILFCYW